MRRRFKTFVQYVLDSEHDPWEERTDSSDPIEMDYVEAQILEDERTGEEWVMLERDDMDRLLDSLAIEYKRTVDVSLDIEQDVDEVNIGIKDRNT